VLATVASSPPLGLPFVEAAVFDGYEHRIGSDGLEAVISYDLAGELTDLGAYDVG